MRLCNRILYTLFLTPALCLASTQLLTQIRDSLDDPPISHNIEGFTSILAHIADNDIRPTDLGPYWTGASRYNQPLSRIQLVQLIHDTLLSFPHLGFQSPPDENAIKAAFSTQHAYMMGKEADTALQQYVYGIIRDLRNNSPVLLGYEQLNALRLKSNSCAQYWETRGGNRNEDVTLLLEDINHSGPVTAPDNNCKKPLCSTNPHRPYNGFFDISREATQLKSNLDSINCQDSSILQGTHTAKKQQTCQILYKRIHEDTHIQAAPQPNSGSDLSSSVALRYIENLHLHLGRLLPIYKTLVLLQIDEQINHAFFNQPGLSSIYQTPSVSSMTLPSCSGGTTSSTFPEINPQACTPPDTYIPNPYADLYVKQVLGVNELKPLIEPGLPVGVPPNVLLIAGQYQSFFPDPRNPQNWKAVDRSQLRAQRGYAIYMPASDIVSMMQSRQAMLLDFFETRNHTQKTLVSELLNKSASIDIIGDIRTQNEKIIQYEGQANQYRTRQLTLLKDSAKWRLHPGNNSWLESVATMNSDSLLREITILLAELKHIEYQIFSNLQKLLLFNALHVSSLGNIPSTRTMFDLMEIHLSKYLLGGAGAFDISNPSQISSHPNTEAQQNQNQALVNELNNMVPPMP